MYSLANISRSRETLIQSNEFLLPHLLFDLKCSCSNKIANGTVSYSSWKINNHNENIQLEFENKSCKIVQICYEWLGAQFWWNVVMHYQQWKSFVFEKSSKWNFAIFCALWNCCFLLLVCVQMLSKVLHKMMIGLQIFAAVIFTSLNLIPAKNAVYHTNIKKKMLKLSKILLYPCHCIFVAEHKK